MNICENCGTQYEGNFCPKCGKQAPNGKTCPKCGAKLNADDIFCPKCGFSFKNEVKEKKINAFGKWLKSHLKIVIPIAVLLVTVIVLACTIPACIAGKNNATYYLVDTDGTINKQAYYTLKSGKWSNDEGESGKYETDGDKIIFYVEFMGETEEWASATVKDGVLTVTDGLSKDVYVSEKHKHSYGKWETQSEASCTVNGVKSRECSCGYVDKEETPASGHITYYNFDETEHWLECQVCNQTTTEKTAHTGTSCTLCGYPLRFILSTDTDTYWINGCAAEITEVTIPTEYNGLPVTSVNRYAFKDCLKLQIIRYDGDIAGWCELDGLENLMRANNLAKALYIGGERITGNLVIPEGVEAIGSGAFVGCIDITAVTFPNSLLSLSCDAFGGHLTETENGITYLNKWAVGHDDTYAENVILRSDTVGIADFAFRGCSIESITLPDGVKAIGNQSFADCPDLTQINIPDSVRFIGIDVFYGCNRLQFNEYGGAKYLGNDGNPYLVLMGILDTSITEYTLNEKTKIIYDGAFAQCYGLTKVNLHSGITYIGTGVFDSSDWIDLIYSGTKAQWNAVEKSYFWNYNQHVNVQCTDGYIYQ